MALALRPAVLLIAVASLMFLLAGALDTLHGCAPAGCTGLSPSAMESYAFGIVNLVIAVLIARGNERMLAVRIGLAAFFVVERPISAVAFGSKPIDVVAVHLLTAAIEAIILVSTLRIWRLGHSVSESDLQMLSLGTEAMALAPAAWEHQAPPLPATARPAGLLPVRNRSQRMPGAGRPARAPTGPRASGTAGVTVGRLAILLALALAADTIAAAAAPGVVLDLSSPRLVAAVLALVILAVALPAVHGRRLALRLLLILSLITFVESAFSPVALGLADTPTLLLHAAAALVALVLAVASVSALRAADRGAPAHA